MEVNAGDSGEVGVDALLAPMPPLLPLPQLLIKPHQSWLLLPPSLALQMILSLMPMLILTTAIGVISVAIDEAATTAGVTLPEPHHTATHQHPHISKYRAASHRNSPDTSAHATLDCSSIITPRIVTSPAGFQPCAMAECGLEMCFTKTINKSVYDDDETAVVKVFAEWCTMFRHDHDLCNPFRDWRPKDHPMVDPTWLALGFSRRALAYDCGYHAHFGYVDPYTNVINEDHRFRADSILKETLGVNVPNKHADLFMIAYECLTCLKNGLFPAAPMIAHHWMINGHLRKLPDGIF